MRVLFVVEDLQVGGAQRHTVALAERLNADPAGGFSCEVLALAGRSPHLEIPADLTVSALGLRPLRPGAGRRIAAALQARQPQLIVCVNPVATLAVRRARGAGGRRPLRVVIFHTGRVSSISAWLRTLPFIPVARSCEALVFVSVRQRRRWASLGLAARQVRILHNGVALDRFTPPTLAGRTAARWAMRYAPQEVVFGVAAALRREKNLPQLVEAVAALRARGTPAQLLIVGDGPERAAVEARAEALGVAGAVRITGLVSDVRPYLAAMDVGVLCSTAVEALPLFALEAMASGLPVVLSEFGGAAEIVTPGHDGWLFPPEDTAALIRRLSQMLDPVARARLGRAAAQTARSRFDAAVMAQGYADLFRSLAPVR
jgi:glycosyltransferase involved in cell wall biosynthesis